MARVIAICSVRTLCAVFGAHLLAVHACAGEWTVVGPAQVLRACEPTARGPLFTDPQGRSWSLVLDPKDDALSNRGGERFWPASALWVDEALAALDPRIGERIGGQVVILPFPRRELVRSSCDGHSIYLSPGVQPLSREAVHFLMFHEVGHLIHRRLLPDWDTPGWKRYMRLRGIDDPRRFNRTAPSADQPHEIFAEDFRRLFGSPAAQALEPLIPSSAPELGPRALAVRAFLSDLIEGRHGPMTP